MRRLTAFFAILFVLPCPAIAQKGAAPAPAPALRPAADFAKLPFFEAPELSPDGTRIAARISIGGQQALAVLDLYQKKKPIVVPSGPNDLLSWDWVNDDWLAVRIGNVNQVEGTDLYVTRIVGVPTGGGGKLVPISFKKGGQTAHILWRATDGSPRIIMSMQKSIYDDGDFWPDVDEVDISTGRARQLVSGRVNIMNWFVDPAGAVRMGLGYDDSNRTSKLLYRPTQDASFRIVDRADHRRDQGLTFPILLAGNAARAFTIQRADGFDALYDLDLAKLETGKVVHRVAGYDIDSVILNPAGTDVAGVRYTSDRSRVHWMDPVLAEVQALIDKAVGTQTAHIVSLSRDQRQMIIWVGDASAPGSYYFFDAGAGGKMQRFSFVNEVLKNERLGPVSTYRYKARDGLSIEAVLTLPKGREAKNLPLILMPHGGPEARDVAEYDWWVQFLASRGYAVVQPNYRGSTGYGQAFQDAGDGQWGVKMQDDLNDAVADLAAKGTIDPKRVCIVGASYGGYAAMRGAQRDGASFRCAISYAGVSDLNGMLSYDGRFLYGKSARAGWREAAPDLKSVSPINHAADFSAPILIMHGKEDLRVPVAQSRRMVARLKDAKKPVDYVEQPLGDHYFSREADRLQFLQVMEAFLAKHNPA
jgi:dipeptidyl aminopeptidase/acylaminoacyl peptidase